MMETKSLKMSFLVFACLLIPNISFSQLIVNAGKDTTFCVELWPDSMILGSGMHIENGVPPYTFVWECNLKLTDSLVFTASDFLSDTTIQSPLIKDYITWSEWLKFTVFVTDKNNVKGQDEINVRFSLFVYSVGYFGVELDNGDSILLGNAFITGGIEPLSYQYQPLSGITNPSELVTWFKPDTSTFYYQIATDSCGCISAHSEAYDIKVKPTGVKSAKYNEHKLNIRQNGDEILYNNPRFLSSRIKIYSLNGELVYSTITDNNHINLSKIPIINGIYVINITVGEITESKKFKN